MSESEAIAAIVLFITAGVTVISLGRAYFSRGARTQPRELARMDERLQRIEQAVDAMSIEVERISEGQRFATRLLSERASEHAARPRES